MADNEKRSNTPLYLLLFLAAIMVAAAVYDFVVVARDSTRDTQFLRLSAQQSLISQSVVRSADEAVAGNQDAFTQLSNGRDQFDNTITLMGNGDPQTLMPAATGEVLSELSVLQNQWGQVRAALQVILSAKDQLTNANQAANGIRQTMPDLLAAWDKFSDEAKNRKASAALIYYATKRSYYGQVILRDVNLLTTGGNHGDVSGIPQELSDAVQNLNRINQAIFEGSPSLGLTAVNDAGLLPLQTQTNVRFRAVNDNLNTLMPLVELLINVQKANATIHDISDQLLNNAQAINTSYVRDVNRRLTRPSVGYGLGLVGILLLVGILYLYVLGGDARRAAQMQLETNERNQQAILRLLDELGSLADGDLTVQVTVTEDITGAIADSINYALEALRGLVATINDTAVQVDAAARQTQATTTHLAEASVNQSKQINTASQSITEMAKSIEQVSANAERSAKVAAQSVEIAHKGGQAVRRTIDGMNSIRETIQETSKRIKRLGESSQEIGDIVELINDIAEQTNILALNAAIQASMAGEAGRGFAVVADEVQRLAERSANATRQIEALVKTIQTDTNEAVISMEQSTAGVVGGAQLAENAGSALDEIEKVANHIATLVQSISNAARQQAQTAGEVSRTMNVIREITAQTTEGTNATAVSVGKLAALATEMRKSVAGFKLPSNRSQETLVMRPEQMA
ncbi:MAG TPA: methyl-accepting chemotaxis protein [Gammaproteobacteria bacterium]|jgi:twitching motility protein PilJ|nr:methyl-accepting chemotaxis protein [Gammaproteobacteria bacterium]